MAFKASNLSVLAYANNFTLWHYTSIDNAEKVGGENYFNAAVDMLRINDLIIIHTDTDEVAPKTKFYLVTGNDGSKVTITVYS